METIKNDEYEQLSTSMDLANDVITKDYLYELSQYEVKQLSDEVKNLDIAEYSRMFKIRKFVSDKKESVLDKFVTVLNAAYTSNATVITIIKGYESYTDYYIGIVSKDTKQENYDVGTQGEIFKGVLSGNFPGVEVEPIISNDVRSLCDDVFSCNYITSISGIASLRNEKENNYEKYVQGIEHLVDSLQGKEYSVVVIADPVNVNELTLAKVGYENLYTQLYPFLKTSLSFNESNSITVTQSHTESVAKSIGESISLTQNHSKSSGWGGSLSYGKSESLSYGKSINKNKGDLLGLATGAVGEAMAILTGELILPIIISSIGSIAGGSIGKSIAESTGKNISAAITKNISKTEGEGTSTTENNSATNQISNSDSQSQGSTNGKTSQFFSENKTVKNLLDKVNKNIERLDKCETYGAFNCATYVISPDPETNAIVANGYNALMRGDNSALQSSYINIWNNTDKCFDDIKEYLKKFSHPLFIKNKELDMYITPASIANSYEIAVNMGMPKKSINGLPVFEMASFGRNVFNNNIDNKYNKKIHLGKIYHMGSIENTNVDLDLKSLAMHTFITGSTGSGKSNTVYQLIKELKKQGVHFLVIEPVKGEYKHVLCDEIQNVYGTNPYYTPLLQLNPFKFSKGIHVLEHIDRLVEIFNVCWPMYAAMPAVLKESIEKAYISAGWNLLTSKNKYDDNLYPTFTDVLNELNKVVTESSFSQEVKDNYIGSLSTRIKSLTNGIYGRIFQNEDIGDEKLFDEDVTIDLSRVGSIETKSMIMGILVMRLQEYRMSSDCMNSDLKHVTVLEEAHNILKRTSTEQNSESSNLLGKSVEMISNAIAEMRTYGEGFVIVDQSPALLDMSVIRNTNTKIIMRLPDEEDRNLVGKSANLSEDQVKELAKIPTGIAAVYQNNWLEPVLCQIHYEKAEGFYNMENKTLDLIDDNIKVIIQNLLNKVDGKEFDINMKEISNYILKSSLSTNIKIKALTIMRKNGKISLSDISSVIYDLVCTDDIEKEAEKADSIEDWKNTFIYADNSILSQLDEISQNRIIECILREQIIRFNKPKEYLDTWYKYLSGEVM